MPNGDAMNFTDMQKTIAAAVTLIALGGSGYALLDAKADKPVVLAVDDKANYVLDRQMESTLSQINRLESKPNKTQDDRDQIKYLREDLQRSRDIRIQR
jgi:hypothetical protein